MRERAKLLVVVKTYPNPSIKYGELVCTGAMRENGEMVRLYPIDLRHSDYDRVYKKYQWIELDIERHKSDARFDSYRPDIDTLVLGEELGTKGGWSERRRIILQRPTHSLEELDDLWRTRKISTGVVKPKRIVDVQVEADKEDWTEEQKNLMSQLRLFGETRKPLAKIPYKFRYHFFCNDTRCKGHRIMVEDWECGRLFLRLLEQYKDGEKAADMVKEKLQIFASSKYDLHFFVVSVFRRPC